MKRFGRPAIFLSAVLGCGCAKPSNKQVATSKLAPHFTATYNGVDVTCNAYVSRSDDPNQSSVALEPEAIVTCNSAKLSLPGGTNTWTGNVPYSLTGLYTITLVRGLDGSALTATVYAY